METKTMAPPLEIAKDAFLKRLPEAERTALDETASTLASTLLGQNRRGAIVAVGGSLRKPWPRKDIDLVLVREDHTGNPHSVDYSREDFHVLRSVAEEAARQNPDIAITETLEPQPDEEFGGLFLRFDGKVTLQHRASSVPFEVIRSADKNLEEFIENRRSLYVILSQE
ncbi:MAG: hypothetical protein HY430_01160 [Candidatus Levybacteria bacterium]|nr:hypothetical protein [Candidatus Levybacteria bacterium]